MLHRCYDEKLQEKYYTTYINCSVCTEWHNFQNFAQWYEENYYEVEGERMCLDKDILVKGNKTYSPETCVFVPNNINVLFVKCDKARGDLPIGVTWHKRDKVYQVRVNYYGKDGYVGYFHTIDEAFQCYKKTKEKYIKEVADIYKDIIPINLYQAMYNYIVEEDD